MFFSSPTPLIISMVKDSEYAVRIEIRHLGDGVPATFGHPKRHPVQRRKGHRSVSRFFQTSQRPRNPKYDQMKFSIVIGTSGWSFKDHGWYSNESEYNFVIGMFSDDCVLEIFSFTGAVSLRHGRV